MKKLLSILAAVGLTATASTAVVACTTTVKADKGVASKDFKNIKLSDAGKASTNDAIAKALNVEVKNGDTTLKAGTDYTADVAATMNSDKTKVDVKVTITVINADIAKDKKQTLKVEVTEADTTKSLFSKKFDEKFDVKLAKGEVAAKGGNDSGTTPSGTTPSGTTPSGTTPSGTTPSGTTPSSTTPSSTTPSSTTPSSTTPSDGGTTTPSKQN